jgi:hypothetical protein
MSLEHPLTASIRRRFYGRPLPLLAVAAAAALVGAPPAMAKGAGGASAVAASASADAATRTRVELHRRMAQRKYDQQMIPRWRIGEPGILTADGQPRGPWRVTTWGPLNGESGFTTTGAAPMEYTGEFLMYWSRIPDFRITEYKVWPTEQGWIARIIFGGTAKDGTPVRAHQVDVVTVDESGKVVRIEYHCDAGEWINQVWMKASGLPAQKVREVLAQPKGWDRLIDIALGRSAA